MIKPWLVYAYALCALVTIAIAAAHPAAGTIIIAVLMTLAFVVLLIKLRAQIPKA